MNDKAASDTELRVLRAMKDILTRVARETAVRPGSRHILSQETIYSIRDCLALISAREMDLAGNDMELTDDRPRYPKEKSCDGTVSVSVDSIVPGQNGH